MAITKAQIDELYERLDEFDSQVKDLNELKKEAINLFSENNGPAVKSIKKGHRAHKELLKNKEEFNLVDIEVAQIVEFLTEEATVVEGE